MLIKDIAAVAGKYAGISLVALMASSCNNLIDESGKHKDYLDPELKLSHDDYLKGIRYDEAEERLQKDKEKSHRSGGSGSDVSQSEPDIPTFSEMLTVPSQPDVGPEKLISLSVTEDVPLKDVLIEISRLADVDMEIDPGISGGIILRVKDRPFSEVIDRVVDLGGLRVRQKGGVLRVERDLAYQVNYPVDFLNLTRSADSSMTIGTSSSSGGDSASSGGVSSGSTSAITAAYDGDLWASVENTLKAILDQAGASTSTALAEIASASTSGAPLNINKQAGVVSVFANEAKHKVVADYLDKIKKSVSSQVLIEARIVEVTLDDEYRTGINWGTLMDSSSGLTIGGNFKGGVSASTDFLTFGIDIKNISTAVSMIEKFGTSRTLSNPRLNAMNNQQAVLTFAENHVYFTLEVQEETDGTGAEERTTLTTTSEQHTVPIGVILALQPSINLDTQEITMNVRPTLSRITGNVEDPGVALSVARVIADNPEQVAIESTIPVVEIRELDSIIKIKSGEVMVIGGLMKDEVVNEDIGVPYLNRMPFLGKAFKSVVKTNEVVETVIFIKATIVPSSGVSEPDKNVYQKFTRDPRQLTF